MKPKDHGQHDLHGSIKCEIELISDDELFCTRCNLGWSAHDMFPPTCPKLYPIFRMLYGDKYEADKLRQPE